MKKLIAAIMILVTVFALAIPALASADEFGGYDMWVNCANGKTLNVREAPSTKSRTITRLECGTKGPR
ncbi:MAG: SH3 domain-containing protein [Clostridia bacterium]|nr:SH3 domain-containing protein [Clostridia bacterium]